MSPHHRPGSSSAGPTPAENFSDIVGLSGSPGRISQSSILYGRVKVILSQFHILDSLDLLVAMIAWIFLTPPVISWGAVDSLATNSSISCQYGSN